MKGLKKLKKVGWVELGEKQARREFRERHGAHTDDAMGAMCIASHINHRQLVDETVELRRAALSASVSFARSSIEDSRAFVAYALMMGVLVFARGWWLLLLVPFVVAHVAFAMRARREWNTAREHMDVIRDYEVPPERFVWFCDDEDVMDVFVGEEE